MNGSHHKMVVLGLWPLIPEWLVSLIIRIFGQFPVVHLAEIFICDNVFSAANIEILGDFNARLSSGEEVKLPSKNCYQKRIWKLCALYTQEI